MNHQERTVLPAALGIALVAAVAYLAYSYLGATSERAASEASFASTTAALELQLADATRQSQELAASLEAERARSAALEKEKGRAEKEVDELEELAELDPELLQKYSKVYFLNENYEPEYLNKVDTAYLQNPAKPVELHRKVEPRLERMIEDAADEKIDLRVISGYRSFATQQTLKGTYVTTYGAGTANSFSAEQGYSEHQLGTTVDLTTPAIGGTSLTFAQTEAYEWLEENAYRYGFILSYPAGNSFYQYEPWHWRFVGEALARKLHRDGKYFYDMDQRDIDEYLGKIFD